MHVEMEAVDVRRKPWISQCVETWEGVAAAISDETGMDDPPVDALEVAALCGLELVPWGREDALLASPRLYYPRGARPVRQHGLVAHELGHWALTWAGEDDSEQGADYVGGALLLPRRVFDPDLRRTGWNFTALRTRHLNASAERIARRITELRDAVATVLDQGKVKSRVSSPWLGDRFQRITKWERVLAEQALEAEETVHGDELCYAVPVIDPPWHRVVVVCEARQLSLRL